MVSLTEQMVEEFGSIIGPAVASAIITHQEGRITPKNLKMYAELAKVPTNEFRKLVGPYGVCDKEPIPEIYAADDEVPPYCS